MPLHNTTGSQDKWIERQSDLGDVYIGFLEIINDLDNRLQNANCEITELKEQIDDLKEELASKEAE